MSADIHASIDSPDCIPLFIFFFRFRSLGHKFAERIAFVGQLNCSPAGCRYAARLKYALFILLNQALAGNKLNQTPASIFAINKTQFPCFHSVIQKYALCTGHRDRIRCKSAVDVSRIDCFQLHIAAGLNLACNGRADHTAGFILFFRLIGARFQIAFAGCCKGSGHSNYTEPHNAVIAPHTVNAFYISIFAFQVDEHTAVPGISFLFGIVQYTDRIFFRPDFTLCCAGFQFQQAACAQVGKRVVRIDRHVDTFGRFQ